MHKFKIALLTGIVTLAVVTVCAVIPVRVYGPGRKIWLTDSSSGKTTRIKKGTLVMLEIANQPDGGYVLDSIKYNKVILRLIKHTQKSPPANSTLGHSGKALWEFIALKAGMSVIKVTASRPWNRKDSVNVYFSNLEIR